MPRQHLLVIESGDNGLYLFRYTADAELGGDTWHESIADIQEQPEFEYQPALGEWYELPAHVEDPLESARNIGLVPQPEA